MTFLEPDFFLFFINHALVEARASFLKYWELLKPQNWGAGGGWGQHQLPWEGREAAWEAPEGHFRDPEVPLGVIVELFGAHFHVWKTSECVF